MRRALALTALVLAIGCQQGAALGAGCARASDCTSPLVCQLGRCRDGCRTDRDCAASARCLLVSGGGACSVTQETNCPAQPCPDGTVCLSGQCVTGCASDTDCPGGPCLAVTLAGTTVHGCGDARATDAGTPGDAGPSGDAAMPALRQLVVGQRTACVLDPNGVVYCWGGNESGVLGDQVADHGHGSCMEEDLIADFSPTPLQVQNAPDVMQIAIGGAHACVLVPGDSRLGELLCWGDNGAGQLANTSVSAAAMVPVPFTGASGAPITGVRRVSAWGNSTVLLTDTSIVGAGDGFDGELGFDAMSGDVSPAHVTPFPSGVRLVDVDITHAGAVIDGDGDVRTFGREDRGSLGLGDGTADGNVHETFDVVPGVGGVRSVDHGFFASCARTATEVDCWGYPYSSLGRNGDHSHCPVPPDDVGSSCAWAMHGLPSTPVDVGMTNESTCVVVQNGDVWCTSPGSEQLVRRTDLPPMRIVDGGAATFCGITLDERVLCWGRGICGETGLTSGTEDDPPNEIFVP